MSNDNYQVTKGESLSFSVVPSSGIAPYTYAWDFDDRLSEETHWDTNRDVLIYSNSQKFRICDVHQNWTDEIEPCLNNGVKGC